MPMRPITFFPVFLLMFLVSACNVSGQPPETVRNEGMTEKSPTLTKTQEREQALAAGETAGPTKGREQPPNGDSVSLVLVNGTLVDGTGSDPVSDAVVVIEGERIVAAGTRSQVFIPSNTPAIDVQGATILPGFINAHVHQANDKDALKAWAQGGVTTVCDLGDNGNPSDLVAFRDEVAHDARYARLVAAGPMLTVPNGYGRRPVTSPEHARQTVTALLDDGVDLIKIGIEDNLQGRRWPMLSTEEIRAIVETAHSRNVPVVAHISRSRHLELALETGVDDVAHMSVDNLSDDLVARMIQADVYWEPTLELWRCVSTIHSLRWDARAINNLRRFSRAGGKVALGTDYAGYGCEFDLGMPMTEIELMHQAGMTPLQIIVAATRNAAHVCNLEGDIGTLEPGKIADILVVEGNPLEDLRALADVRMVIHNGVIIRE